MSSNSFELHAKADEWMDVTPKEEILQAQLDRLKEAFDKCSTQLESCRLENDLLKGFKTNLEEESHALKVALRQSQLEVETKSKEWNDLNVWTEERMRSYQQTIREQELKNSDLEDQKSTLLKAKEQEAKRFAESEQRYQAAMTKLDTEKQGLQDKVADLQRDNRQQHETVARFYKDLEATRSDQERMQRELVKAKETIAKQQQQMQESRKDTGTIATLAQELKAQKVALERALTQTKQALEASKAKEADRTQKLSTLREQHELLQRTSTTRLQELETAVQQQTKQLADSKDTLQELRSRLDDATERIETLQHENDELTTHMSRMEAGRHEWLEQKTELQESLEESYQDLQTANERLHELEETLEQTELERASLEAHQATFQDAADREAALQMQMQEQQAAFEERLREIRTILGMKFTAAIQSEVQHKFRNVEMPVSFRVPLLAQKIV